MFYLCVRACVRACVNILIMDFVMRLSSYCNGRTISAFMMMMMMMMMIYRPIYAVFSTKKHKILSNFTVIFIALPL